MRIEELVKGLNFLGLAYGKEYNQMEAQQIYEFVKEYDYDTFIRATKEIIRTSKFLPKIADLIENCDKQKEVKKVEILRYMKSSGYFNTSPYGEIDQAQADRNYIKAITFLQRGIIPDWFQEDINYYSEQMHRIQLENKSGKLIS